MTIECPCTRCEGTGFLNTHQLPDFFHVYDCDPEDILTWMDETEEPHDVTVCDCCGDGESWNYKPGYHNLDKEETFNCI